jgi:hypothetical protein
MHHDVGMNHTRSTLSQRRRSRHYCRERPAGGSDDINFQDAGITSGVVSIYPDSELDLAFHRPEDDPQHIQSSSHRTIGILSAHVLAAQCGGATLIDK